MQFLTYAKLAVPSKNRKKSIAQMIALLHVLGLRAELVIDAA